MFYIAKLYQPSCNKMGKASTIIKHFYWRGTFCISQRSLKSIKWQSLLFQFSNENNFMSVLSSSVITLKDFTARRLVARLNEWNSRRNVTRIHKEPARKRQLALPTRLVRISRDFFFVFSEGKTHLECCSRYRRVSSVLINNGLLVALPCNEDENRGNIKFQKSIDNQTSPCWVMSRNFVMQRNENHAASYNDEQFIVVVEFLVFAFVSGRLEYCLSATFATASSHHSRRELRKKRENECQCLFATIRSRIH